MWIGSNCQKAKKLLEHVRQVGNGLWFVSATWKLMRITNLGIWNCLNDWNLKEGTRIKIKERTWISWTPEITVEQGAPHLTPRCCSQGAPSSSGPTCAPAVSEGKGQTCDFPENWRISWYHIVNIYWSCWVPVYHEPSSSCMYGSGPGR